MCGRMTLVAERVRQIREAKGLGMQYVADVLGISQSTLSRYERGKLKLDAELLPRLGEALRVDPCLFVRDVPLTDSAILTDTLHVDRQPRREASYLDAGTITTRWEDRLNSLPQHDVQLLVDFLEHYRRQE